MVEERKELIKETSVVETSYVYDIVKNSKVVVFEWTLDIDVPTKYVSKNIDQFGYKPEDFYQGPLKDFWLFVHPEDRDRVKDEVYDARKLGDTFTHQYRILTKSGQTRWVEERIQYEKENGTLSSEKGIILDITDRKNLQIALQRSKDKYERIFENSSVIIFTMTLDGKVHTINKMFEKTLGYDKSFQGHNISEILINDHAFDLLTDLSGNSSFDIEVRCKSKQIKTLNISTNMIDTIGEEIEIVAVDVSEKKKDEQKIRYLSYHDKLTNVYNRAYFDDLIDKYDRNKRYPFSIVIGDINGLKDLNDHYGHKKGDMLIRHMADICVKSCRDGDYVCRIGGDEFAIVCPDTDEQAASSICERIRHLCSNTYVDYVGYPSIALGHATKSSDENSVDEIFKHADNNMYRNKMTYSESSSGMFLKALQLTLEKSGHEEKEHLDRVKHFALMLGKAIDLNQSDIDDLSVVAKLHDIGKIGVPDEILNKKGPLTEEEYEVIKGHAYFGYSMLKATPSTIRIAEYILYHHEWYNGTGYPDGLSGENIPLISRIIQIADAFAVMIDGAVYKAPLTREQAIKALKDNSGSQFDPNLVKTFIDMME
ncbi:diguanylate cyclase [Acidaminobacter sp. JC074]|uniref:sensor domain-containing diguanylate cyclase/phosphohydrolase n=1 Tax=Acidaminobacter sp. JC074 TaxID=2530199 RepID=UPI001F0FCF63|nr:HD domain-containing phosphohydrolase [Acidaminobacter sp. JC074]MCH4887622.1 diguanylate cyclase [Acidaminobacter sp. JC074]